MAGFRYEEIAVLTVRSSDKVAPSYTCELEFIQYSQLKAAIERAYTSRTCPSHFWAVSKATPSSDTSSDSSVPRVRGAGLNQARLAPNSPVRLKRFRAEVSSEENADSALCMNERKIKDFRH